MNRRSFLVGASALATVSRVPTAWASPSRCLLFLGSRTHGQGIFSCFFDAKTGSSTPVSLVAQLELPTAFAVSANKRFLYSTSEVGNDGKSSGTLSAFAIDHRTGKLNLLNTVSAGGGGPTFVTLDHTGGTILVADFGSGCTNAFRVLADGRLGHQSASLVDYGTGPTKRQAAPHAHCVTLSPDNRFVLSPDLGADRMFISEFDENTGSLVPHNPPFVQMPAGSGPRQVVFHPSGKFVYLITELAGNITTFAWNASEGLAKPIQTISTLPESASASDVSGGAIVMHRSGRFLYTTTRNDNSLEMFAVDQASGILSRQQHVLSGGKTPWGAAIDPTGDHLVAMNMDSNSVSVFRIDGKTGDLQLTRSDLSVPTPVSGVFVQS